MSAGDAANSGPRMVPSETARPPASTVAIVCAAASRRLQQPGDLAQRRSDRTDRAEVRAGADDDLGAGCAHRLDGVLADRRTDADGSTRWVTSLAPMMIAQTSG